MPDNQINPSRHLTFSQRYGYEPLPQPMRLEDLSGDLRCQIWNATRNLLISISGQRSCAYWFDGDSKLFVQSILGTNRRVPDDEIRIEPTNPDRAADLLKSIIIDSKFNIVLDFLESIINYQHDSDNFMRYIDNFAVNVESLFDRFAVAYWLDKSQFPCRFFPRSNKAQGDATREAIKTIRSGGMEGADTHLRQAAEHINAQQRGFHCRQHSCR